MSNKEDSCYLDLLKQEQQNKTRPNTVQDMLYTLKQDDNISREDVFDILSSALEMLDIESAVRDYYDALYE